MLRLRAANPALRSAAAARSACSGPGRVAARKPFGLKIIGLEVMSGSWSVVPTGQTMSVSLMAVGPQGVGEGILDRGGLDAELVGDLAAVDDERFLELVLHLHQFPQGRVDQSE